jgi:hypothetical protein
MWQDDLCAAAACPPAPDRNTKDRHDMSHTHVKTMPRLASPRMLMWLPAAALATAGLLAATGFGLVPSSGAASSGSTTVGATVAKEVHVNLNDAGQCGPVTGDTSTKSITGTSLQTTDGDISLATCRLTFGSNNSALGAQLLVESTRTSGSNSFCAVVATTPCSAPQFTDVSTAGVAAASFGTGEAAMAGNFGITATANSGCSGGMTASTNRYGLQQNTDATPNGATVCSTASTTDGDVTIDYRVNPGASQPASTSYLVQTTFTATAN